MNENRINIFKCFIYSITGFDRYRVLLRQSFGKAVGYLILLAFLMSIVVFVPFYKITMDMTSSVLSFITEMPDFKLTGGRLEVYGDMPIVIDEANLPVVIDTNPGVEDSILSQYDNVLLFTSDKVVVKSYVNRQEFLFDSFEGFEITKAMILDATPVIKAYINFMFIFTFIFMSAFFVGAKFISALFVSIIGMIANSSLKTNLTYKNIYKLSIFSMTLPLIICTIIDALMLGIPFVSVLFYIGSGIYIFGAVKSIRKELDAAGGNWGPYGGDNFDDRYYQNNGFGNPDRGNNAPGSSFPDYRYGGPARPDQDHAPDKPAGAPPEDPTKDPGSDAPDGQQDSSENDEK